MTGEAAPGDDEGVGDRTAATLGFILAGLALAAALVEDPSGGGQLPAGSAAVAAVLFVLRRHDRLGRLPGAALAGLSSLTTAGLAIVVLFAPAIIGVTANGGQGLVVTAILAIGGVLAADADRRGTPRDRLVDVIGASARGLAIGLGGLLAIIAWSIVLGSLIRSVSPGDIPPTTGVIISTLALGLGTGSVAAFTLRARAADRSFIDLHRPGLRDGAYAVSGVLLVLGLNLAIGLLFMRFGVDSATHSIVRTAESNPEILLVLIPLSYLIIAPGEELLFRNVIQKSLYAAFSRNRAVVVASAIFALAHILAYSDPDGGLLSTLTTLVVIFTLSLVLGAAYERTDNLLVPISIHGTFNAIAFVAIYVQLIGL